MPVPPMFSLGSAKATRTIGAGGRLQIMGMTGTLQIRRRLGAWLVSAAWVGAGAGFGSIPLTAAAQSLPTVSRPVVQQAPSASSQRLNAALARIARDPRDFSALIDAGDAANALGDPEAAAGFYTRADGISPNNPRIKAGLARALVLQGNPVKAIPLFAVAEAGGAAVDVTADRGLAYDLVGDPVTAQKYYRTALARRDDDEVRRRLGVSLAITGDAAGSEAMLMPLLRKQDKPGWRSHAFALAIAGKTKEAVDTVNAILPGTLAQSVTPYLRYMPRLTHAQQAAAANLGKFPRASEIGRDDPAVAAYAPTTTRLASADAGLIPQGKPLGSGRSRAAARQDIAAPLTRSQRRAQEKAAQLARAEAAAAARVAPPDPRPTIARDSDGELPPIGASGTALAAATVPTATPAATPGRYQAPLPRTGEGLASPSGAVPPSPRPSLAQVRTSSVPDVRRGQIALPNTGSAPAATPAPAPAPSATVARTTEGSAAPGFDLARLSASTPAAAQPTTPSPTTASPTAAVPATAALAEAAPSPPPDPVSLEQIFADLGAPSRAAAPVSGAVDITAIKPAKPPEPELVKLEAPVEDKATAAAKVTAGKGKAALAKAAEVESATPAGKATKKVADAKLAQAEDAKTTEAKGAKAKTDAKAGSKKADPKKPDPKKSAPSRIWAQIGVGRDMSAIAFDWRRLVKDNPALLKGKQASTSDMGRTNRILVGPFETQKAASAFVAQAKKAGLNGAFAWTSAAGQAVDPFGAK